MRTLPAVTLVALLVAGDHPVRFEQNPMLTPASSPTIGDNINGPSLIRMPAWVERPLGRYYLYFSHHAGKFIRLAYADQLAGPWTVHEPGTLRLEEAPRCYDHVASPDMHVDEGRREILMYFHCPSGGSVDSNGRVDINEQKTFLATSDDGLRFHVAPQPLGPAYFRVFRWGEYYYALVRAGIVLRSRDMRSPFEPGPTLIGADSGRLLRHAAVDLRGDLLRVYYSRIGDRPERILLSETRLTADWSTWRASVPVDVLRPEETYEGADRPLEVSMPDEARGRVRQLRDPGVFKEGGRTYLLYSIAGESGLAIAELREGPELPPGSVAAPEWALLLGFRSYSGGLRTVWLVPESGRFAIRAQVPGLVVPIERGFRLITLESRDRCDGRGTSEELAIVSLPRRARSSPRASECTDQQYNDGVEILFAGRGLLAGRNWAEGDRAPSLSNLWTRRWDSPASLSMADALPPETIQVFRTAQPIADQAFSMVVSNLMIPDTNDDSAERLSFDAAFDARWAAWQTRGRIGDRAVRRNLLVLITAVVIATAIVYLFLIR